LRQRATQRRNTTATTSSAIVRAMRLLASLFYMNAALPATADAAALAKMAIQGLINGAVVEGPLTVDSALSRPFQPGAREIFTPALAARS
jgi:phosphotransacetylase